MIGRLSEVLEPMLHAINNKVASVTAAAGLVAVGNASQDAEETGLKNLAEVPISEIFSYEPSVAAFATYLGGAWIIFCFSREIVKGLAWLWSRYSARKN